MIVRQTQFHIPVLRQAPAGLDRITAAAARGGMVHVSLPDGMDWLPLGSRLVDRLHLRLRGGAVDRNSEGISRPRSPLLAVLPSQATNEGAVFEVVFVEWGQTLHAPRSLRETAHLGVLEWGTIAPATAQGEAAMSEIERRTWSTLQNCGLVLERAEGGRGRVLWSIREPDGRTTFLRCGRCGYLAEASTARFMLPASAASPPESLREVATPGANTIKDLCEQLNIPPSSTLKALFLTTGQGEGLLALVRGDLEVSLEKLGLEIGTDHLRPAAPEEIRRLDVVAGYAGPVGLNVRPGRRGDGVWVVADRSVVESSNLVTGANREEMHLAGVNYPRDYAVTEVIDLARAPKGASCITCGGQLVEEKGLIVAERRISDLVPAGAAQVVLVSFQISLGAVAAAVLASSIREKGMLFPAACAAFHVHLIELPGGLASTQLVEALERDGFDILVDDRDLSAGVKFADSEWIGSPVRIVSGRKSAEAGGFEVQGPGGRKEIVREAEAVGVVKAALGEVM